MFSDRPELMSAEEEGRYGNFASGGAVIDRHV